MSALMCAGICWMLQAWLPPPWALLGGILAVLRIGLFSYWINTYSGAGAISAFGGALVLGALPRFLKGARLRHGLLMAAGIVLLALTRPYEGLLLCIPAVVLLARWILFGKNRPTASAVICRNALPLLLLVIAGVWMGYYDYRAFGNPTTLPYTVDRETYAVAPYYIWQSTRPAPVYRHEALRKFYCDFEMDDVDKVRSVSGFAHQALSKVKSSLLFFGGPALLIPLMMMRRVLLDRRIRFLVVCGVVMVFGTTIEIFLIPHYLAPFTVVFYAIGLQCMRHLRVWRPEGRKVGLTTIRLTIALCFTIAAVRVFAGPLHLTPPKWPSGQWVGAWYGPGNFGANRADVQARLEQLAGKQLVIVRYSPQHYPLDEWVYNSAEIDDSKVIWARDMDASKNLELLHYYKDRKVWMVEPDSQPAKVYPYPGPQ